jgi:hypothetical protein
MGWGHLFPPPSAEVEVGGGGESLPPPTAHLYPFSLSFFLSFV